MKKAFQVAVILMAGIQVNAQGTFQNLNFEDTNPGLNFGLASAASALPYWTAYIGGVQQTEVWYNGVSTGAPQISLLGPALGPIDGDYSVLLTGSFPASTPSISQTGVIPAGTKTLLFKAVGGNGALGVTIDNQSVPFSPIANGPNYTLFAANISAWAGDTEQLTFSALQDTFSINWWELDDISFSPNAVPEPTSFALMGTAGLIFAGSRLFAPKRAWTE